MSTPTTSTVDEGKLDADTIKFIDSLIADSHQEVYFKGWADIVYKEGDNKLKPRLLVVSNFRLYIIKFGVVGRSVRQSFLFLHLKSMMAGKKPNQLILQFDEDPSAKEFGYVVIDISHCLCVLCSFSSC